MKLIDADKLKEEMLSRVKTPIFFREIIDIIESQPTVKLTVDNMPRYTHNLSVETRWDADDIKTPPFTQELRYWKIESRKLRLVLAKLNLLLMTSFRHILN
jgi:hypothetical protein